MSGERPLAQVKLRSLEEMFGPLPDYDVEEFEKSLRMIKLENLEPFPHHPFKEYSEEKMAQMTESVKQFGVRQPLIVRELTGDAENYEIIAGHNRLAAARRAGLKEVPVIVSNMDDDEALLFMVDSNFQQRENILPSEKAFAYKLQLEALKRQAGRPQNNSGHVDQNFGNISRDVLADKSEDSSKQIQRYIRLTSLIPPLMERVDTQKLAFVPAVALSYLTIGEQVMLEGFLKNESMNGVSTAQAEKLKARSEDGKLTDDALLDILADRETPMLKKITVSKTLRPLIPSHLTPREAEKLIFDALTVYYEMNKGREQASDTEQKPSQQPRDQSNDLEM